MNKYKQLTKQIARTGIVAAVFVGACAAFYVGLSLYADSVSKQKSEVESTLSTDKDLLRSLREQMEKSGAAEKRYAVLREKRKSNAYYSTIEEFYEFVGQLKSRYQLDNIYKKLSKSQKVVKSDKEALKHFKGHDVMVRPVGLKFKAVSDLHVFSFFEELRASAPGMIRIDNLSIRRNGDLTETSYNNFTTGVSSLLVDVDVDMTLITIVPKEQTEGAQAEAGVPAANAPTP